MKNYCIASLLRAINALICFIKYNSNTYKVKQSKHLLLFVQVLVSCSPCSVVAPLRRQERSNPTDWLPTVCQQGELTPARVAGTGQLLSFGELTAFPAKQGRFASKGSLQPPCCLATFGLVSCSPAKQGRTN
jgi:hypothetical protein